MSYIVLSNNKSKQLACHQLSSPASRITMITQIVCFDEVIRLNPKDYLAWNNKGDSLIALDRFNESIVCFDEAIKLDPKKINAWTNKGEALFYLEKFEESLSCFNTVIMLVPEDSGLLSMSEAWTNKGEVLKKMGRAEEAEQCFVKSKEFEDS